MQKLAEICIRRPVFAAMIILSLVVVGSASYFKLGVDRFPSVDLPTVSVRTNLPGASPEEMETLVSQRIEEVVNTVDGIDQLRSVSGQGTSFVMATFNLNRDIDTAAQDVRDRVATVVRDALRRQNSDVPGGNVETGKRELVLRTLGRFNDPREMEDLVVANINGAPIKIRDIGRVEDGTKEQRSVAHLNGVPTVTLEIRRQSGANSVAVIRNVKAQLNKVSAQLPSDIKMEIIRDQERYLDAA